jgi:hypothetical protein
MRNFQVSDEVQLRPNYYPTETEQGYGLSVDGRYTVIAIKGNSFVGKLLELTNVSVYCFPDYFVLTIPVTAFALDAVEE